MRRHLGHCSGNGRGPKADIREVGRVRTFGRYHQGNQDTQTSSTTFLPQVDSAKFSFIDITLLLTLSPSGEAGGH